MNKLLLLLAILLFQTVLQAQEIVNGSISGKLTDKEMQGEPLPFANVLVDGTSKGATTDMNGLFEIPRLEPGVYTLSFSFIGYETLTLPDIRVVPGKITEVNASLGASAAALEEVVINTVSRKDSEIALLLEQKKAVEIRESIGARELARLGVSDAATATTKISGVSSSEASGDIFVRGLGDRYLYTTLNGLPVPSDDVERKNIELGLFPTEVLQSLSISKTYSAESSADQASGNINITTRELLGQQELKFEIGAGINTNVANSAFENFKVAPAQDQVLLGFFRKEMDTETALTQQSWDPKIAKFPVNHQFGLTAGKSFGEKFEVLFIGSQDVSLGYQKGLFKEYRANFINDSIIDAETFSREVVTTGLADLSFEADEENGFGLVSLFINRVKNEVFEGGRNGEAFFFEETAPAEGLSQFLRDQNLTQTRLWVNQLLGTHQISKKNILEWAVGFNYLNSAEPLRIRNELNFRDDFIQLGRTGGFQQRKSSQEIEDRGINALVKDEIFLKEQFSLQIGSSFRRKQREFISKFYGLEETSLNLLNPESLDDLSSIFTAENLRNGSLEVNELQEDVYSGELFSVGGFAEMNYAIEQFNINFGMRYQQDELEVNYDVGNISGRIGNSKMEYASFYPALNLKYELNELSNLRFAAGKTITLPEFKEVAPFEYVSQTGQVTRGNPDLQASRNYNLDLKWEMFPTVGELISLTGFYKMIEDPINKVQDRGSAGVYSFYNAGNEAEVFGLELETRLDLLDLSKAQATNVAFGLNVSRMWHEQDLKKVTDASGNFIRTFRYKGLTETGLQGASDWIFNSSLILTTGRENPLMASIAAGYASDKIYALGAPEIQTQSEIYYNDAIIEKGFVTLDAVVKQNLGEHWTFSLKGKNLLNPKIERVQQIKPSTTGVETTETVRSYTAGSILSFGMTYTF